MDVANGSSGCISWSGLVAVYNYKHKGNPRHEPLHGLRDDHHIGELKGWIEVEGEGCKEKEIGDVCPPKSGDKCGASLHPIGLRQG